MADQRLLLTAIGYAQHSSRSEGAVIRVYDNAGKMIAMHEHAGECVSIRVCDVRALVRGLGVGCANLHYHKIGVRFCPGERVLFRVEKTIDDDRVALSRTSPA